MTSSRQGSRSDQACVTLWNTIYLKQAVTQLRAEVTRTRTPSSPGYRRVRSHINVHGHYILPPVQGHGCEDPAILPAPWPPPPDCPLSRSSRNVRGPAKEFFADSIDDSQLPGHFVNLAGLDCNR
jgi:hypothetical protein